MRKVVREGDRNAAVEQLFDAIGAEPVQEPRAPAESEFRCRACHLIFARSCLGDLARLLCKDCLALDGVPGPEFPHVRPIHHPCPACGALVMTPEREEVSCGFVCPSCRVHLMKLDGHLHLIWNHREAGIGGIGA